MYDREMRLVKRYAMRVLAETTKENPDIRKLIRLADCDLVYGTEIFDDEERAFYPGFVTACKRIREWFGDTFSEVYLDEEGEPCSPEEDPDNGMRISTRSLRKAMFPNLDSYL